jgi:hypothetical protein
MVRTAGFEDALRPRKPVTIERQSVVRGVAFNAIPSEPVSLPFGRI